MLSLKSGRLLVVCVGNICRSPVAAEMLRQKLPAWQINSAGLAGLSGHDIESMAREIAAENGLICPVHQGARLTEKDCLEHDLILVMESQHMQAVHRLQPQARGRVFLLGEPLGGQEISDPYGQSREFFQHTHQLMLDSVDAWVPILNRG